MINSYILNDLKSYVLKKENNTKKKSEKERKDAEVRMHNHIFQKNWMPFPRTKNEVEIKEELIRFYRKR